MLRTLVLSYYPRVYVSEDMIARCMGMYKRIIDKNTVRQALCVFDVFMGVCHLRQHDLSCPEIIARFWGFLLSETNATYIFAWRILTCVRKSADEIGLNLSGFKSSCGRRYEHQCRALYANGYKDAARLSFYEGWWARWRSDREQFVNLIPFYVKYGESYTSYVFSKLKTYLQKHTTETLRYKIRLSDSFARIVSETFLNVEELQLLQNSHELSLFMEAAYSSELAERLKNGYDLEALYREWAALIHFVMSFYVRQGILPEPEYPFAIERYTGPATRGVNTHRGRKKLIKLITPIPDTISNQDAASKLYEQINGDISGVVKACEEARQDIISAYRRRKKAAHLAEDAEVYRQATSSQRLYMSRSKLWESNPYPDIDDKEFERVFGCLKRELSSCLGLMDSTTLLPFLYLLINEVPAVTKSWLLNYQVKDKHNQDTDDYEESNRTKSLKRRRGPASALQGVHLTPKAQELIDEIKELTVEARAYLQKNNKIDAKYLLLTSATGTSLPSKKTKWSGMSVQQNKDSLMAKKIEAVFGEDASQVLENLTPKTMRTSSAVIVYFKTSSVHAMAEALGQKTYIPKLLDKYLPKPIRQFYLSRWIRTFQLGIIFECFKESEYLLDVMNIDTLGELETFIKHHRLSPLPPQLNLKNWLPANERNDGGTVVKGIIPVCPMLCTLLITMAPIFREWQSKGHTISEKYLNWALNGEYLTHAVALYERGEIEVVSEEVASIFRKSGYSIPLAAKLRLMIEDDEEGLSYA